AGRKELSWVRLRARPAAGGRGSFASSRARVLALRNRARASDEGLVNRVSLSVPGSGFSVRVPLLGAVRHSAFPVRVCGENRTKNQEPAPRTAPRRGTR